MKKLFTLLTMLVIGIGSMWGDKLPKFLTASQIRENATGIRIGLLNVTTTGGKYINGEAGTTNPSSTGKLQDIIGPTGNQVLVLEGASDSKYYLKREGDNKYLKCAAGGNFELVDNSTNATSFGIYGKDETGYGNITGYDDLYSDIDKSPNEYMIRFIANNQYINGQQTTAVGGLRGGTGAWSFNYVVNADYFAKIKYEISDGSSVIYTSEQMGGTVGETISTLPSELQRPYCTYTVTPTTIVSGENIVPVTVTYNLPFTVSSDFENATWYKAYFRGQSDEAAKYISHKTGTSYSTTTIEPVLTKASMWAFTGNPYDGFKVMNRAAGEGYYLGYDATGSNANVYMKPTGNSFLAKPITGGFSGFCLYVENTNSVLHDYHDKFSFWNDSKAFGDQGSAWTITEVVENEIAYTVTDENGQSYEGTYWAVWDGDNTAEPSIPGAYGATFSNKVFSNTSGYSLTADITFEFPVSSNSINKPTAIKSRLGNSLWYAKDDKVIADNEANTTVYDVYADNYRWNIIPVFSAGTFAFKLYNVGAGKYIPNNPSANANTATTLTADGASAGAFLYSHYNAGNGFYDTATSKFLTINTSGTAQNIYLWSASSGTGHAGSAMSFPELVVVLVSDAFNALKAATKLDILDGSTVMGPEEFAAPASINAAIDAAKEVENTDEAKLAFIEGDNGKMIQNYLNQVAKYGAPANIKITMNKEYGTMILPCPCARIDGLDIYSCSSKEDNTLTLTPVEGIYVQNKPYIIHATEGNKYTIIGWNKGSTGTHSEGWLTGVLNSTTDIPVGSYMLATNKTTKVQAFYKVTGSGVKCAINKCYLTVPSASDARTLYLDVDGEITAIEEVFGDETEKQGTIYNLAGQRLTKVQKGINIINGKKVIK